ncbi:MAG: hypothetical protein V7L04_28270 [Nostoc sp.]|uniref:hypothetical protein n=1 Tax=Nostoc sp. TaxID=1180 RepID=UPI002FF504DD
MPNTSLREAAPTATLLRRRSVQVSTSKCPMPHAPCPMPHAPCPMPYALCPMPLKSAEWRESHFFTQNGLNPSYPLTEKRNSELFCPMPNPQIT